MFGLFKRNTSRLQEVEQQWAARVQDAEQRLEKALQESLDIYDRFIDPRERYYDDADGMFWNPIGGSSGQRGQPSTDRAGFANEQQLSEARERCRWMAERNEYCINGLENRISYVVGTGHVYTAVSKKRKQAPQESIWAVQDLLDEWMFQEYWGSIQQETKRRIDRDGEAFIRFFERDDGLPTLRFVEPWQVSAPTAAPEDLFGVKVTSFTDPTSGESHEDVVRPVGYWIDGKCIESEDVQHRKSNVDCNVRRGMPLFWPVLPILQHIGKVREYAAHLAWVRASYAVIKQPKDANSQAGADLVGNRTSLTKTDPVTGQTRRFEKHHPGMVKTASGNIEYLMQQSNIGGADYEIVIRFLAQAVASRLCMPEFMLTSDASNANYSSTLVSEGTAVKSFERLQADQKAADLEVIWRVIRAAVNKGMLPPDTESLIEIQVECPRVQYRDELAEVQKDQILVQLGALSIQTLCSKHDLDFEQEMTNIEQHAARTGGIMGAVDPLMQQALMQGIRPAVGGGSDTAMPETCLDDSR